MAGLYIHIPFCKKRCLYCDFFSTTLLERRKDYVDTLLRELAERKHELNEPIRTVYLGGGTPSTLDINDIQRLLQAIDLSSAEEVSMELNPGDATLPYLRALRSLGINRLSIGIQSFQDELLTLIGRRHTAAQALTAVREAQQAGFDNISIDLMYALPTQTMAQWQADIDTALGLHVQHISCYGLMYEEGTAMTRLRDEGRLMPVEEDTENAMYDLLCDQLKAAGWNHYEVSNFALPGFESKHNSSYWNGTPYIGIGAGAHSYIQRVRSWNPSDLEAYISGHYEREKEVLTDKDLYNEAVMLGLRTIQGMDPDETGTCYGLNPVQYRAYIDQGLLRRTDDGRLVATQQGLHILNRIIEDLMME